MRDHDRLYRGFPEALFVDARTPSRASIHRPLRERGSSVPPSFTIRQRRRRSYEGTAKVRESDAVDPPSYEVVIDDAPAYEAAVSFVAYLMTKEQRTLENGPAWARGVRASLPPSLTAALDALAKDKGPAREELRYIALLVWCCPEPRDSSSFVAWLDGLSPTAFEDVVAPYLPPAERPRVRALGHRHDRLSTTFAGWNEFYVRGLDPRLAAGLHANAVALRELAGTMDPCDLVELATGGVRIEPRRSLARVLLAPQQHYRPWNLIDAFEGLRVMLYPCDALPAEDGAPPPALLRLTHALSDGSRLRILRFVAPRPRSFGDIVRETGLAKSTISYHMVALRAAGLVRVLDGADDAVAYALRPDALDDMGIRLSTFLRPTSQP